MLEVLERETAPHPTHSVVVLHGLGADGSDFVPIVPQLVRSGWPPLRFVFPHAPLRPITINAGMRMRGWYDIGGFDLAQKQDEAGIRASIVQVEALIAREAERRVPAERVILAGFSQGGAIALAGGIRHPQTLGGIVALSTYLPIAEIVAAERHAANARTPIFMAHGAFDPVVPQRLGELSRERLLGFGHPLSWHSYPMAHQVCPQEISDLADWLEERLTA
ncbi:MAG TPA: alpha/beta fold hydrolase [Rhodanobacteraceae bacterium]|nr:alpha/beta fold hydrolase [Rhodanobacteraceae bacterium]